MTERQLRTRVRFWQRKLALLGVEHWRITVEVLDKIETPDDSNPIAEANPDAKYDSVTFSFARKDVAELHADGTLDELIVHEWLHVVDRTQDEVVHALMEYLPPQSREVVSDREEAARERRVENIARLIVKLVQSA